MKYCIALLCLLAVSNSIFAQSETVRIVYSFSHMRDTNNPHIFYKEQMMLVLNANASEYKSYSLYIKDSIDNEQQKKGLWNESYKVIKATYEQHYYFFSKQEHVIIQPWIDDTLLIKEPADRIRWQITEETKDIAGYKCTKAQAEFKGRKWEAWFCADISSMAGPWKLNGLPGTILEAKDEKAQIKFEFAALQNMPSTEISLPTYCRQITQKDFLNMKNALKQNPSAFLNAAKPAETSATTSSDIQISSGSSTTIKTRNTINNPIELN